MSSQHSKANKSGGTSATSPPLALSPGILLAIEGIDGAGKTTQAGRLARAFNAAGLSVVSSKEPTEGPWGQRLRASARTGRLSLAEELDLFIRDRRDHVATLIQPALDRGDVVILDRYYFSTVAYQGARGADIDEIFERNAFAPEPDLLILIDLDPRLSLQRIQARGDTSNFFEKIDNLTRCRAIFNGLSTRVPTDRLLALSGRMPIPVLTEKILDACLHGPLKERLCARQPTALCPRACEAAPDAACPWRTLSVRLPRSEQGENPPESARSQTKGGKNRDR